MKLKHLDLFSGIGGFSLGLEATGGFKTVAFCEIDTYCQKVLSKHWPDVPVHSDIRGLEYNGAVDIITGGYPCQPFSVAGKQRGKEDPRHLWPEMFRIIREVKPRWLIAENVEGHIKLGLDSVLDDLEGAGYTCWPFIIPACAVGAPHRRNRIWIIANARCKQQRRKSVRFSAELFNGSAQGQQPETRNRFADLCEAFPNTQHDGSFATTQQRSNGEAIPDNTQGQNSTWQFEGIYTSRNVADTASERQQGQGELKQPMRETQNGEGQANLPKSISFNNQWAVEPAVGRVANGIPNRVDRLRALGNAVVPQIPELIGHAILEYEGAV